MKKILLTGSSRGIGLAIVKQLLSEGAQVIGLSRTNTLIHERFLHLECDLGKIDALSQLTETLSKTHSDLDAIICNAGFGRFGGLEEFSYKQIKEQMNVNFLAHACLVRAFLPHMKRKTSGSLIFIGSEAALEGARKGAIYCASKFALRGFAQALREECSTCGIGVSLIHPGMVSNSFYDHLSFKPGEEPDTHLLSEDVANLVSVILKMRPGSVIDEIKLSPQKKKRLLSKEV